LTGVSSAATGWQTVAGSAGSLTVPHCVTTDDDEFAEDALAASAAPGAAAMKVMDSIAAQATAHDACVRVAA
jgi:hypothetical protein